MPVDVTARHADRIHSAISSNGAAKSALIASWQRSASLHKLDPDRRNPPERLTDSELRKARQEVEALIRVAQPGLDRLHTAVGGVGCCVLLADRNGVPVERRGAPGDDATFLDWGLWPGAVWSEDSEGTNGIGTCLVEHRTLTIHRWRGRDGGPKAYLQASIHAEEIPALLAADHLAKRLDALARAGRIRGEVVLVPYANPIGRPSSTATNA